MTNGRVRKVTMSTKFKRDLKKQYLLLVSAEWVEVFGLLVSGAALPEKYCNHPLKGNYASYMECHVKPDLLLVYKITTNELALVRLGSHSELF